MKSVTLSLILLILVTGTVMADPGRVSDREFGPGQPLAIAPWVTSAPAVVDPGIDKNPMLNAFGGLMGAGPAILLETDSYVYGPSGFPSGISLNLTMRRNGYVSPVTLYLYWQNRVTGERMYYNIPDGGFVADNEQKDLFGDGSPVAINPFDVTDFQLFGVGGAVGAARTPDATGRYQWVLEVRSQDGSVVLGRGNAMYAVVDSLVVVTSVVSSNTTWTSNNAYLLGTSVFVTSGNTLTIEPGTVVFGSNELGADSFLAVSRGGMLDARGTAMQPIIMTSDLPVGQRGPEGWGGLILNGNAQINAGFGTSGYGFAEGEGGTGEYGGGPNGDDSSSCGYLSYLRVEFAGAELSPDNELNGIAFQGCGNGTMVDHIQVHFNKDDAVEFFGGDVDAKYLVLTNIGDDNIDWTQGWRGRVQFAAVIQNGIDADQGFEGDNNGSSNDALPRANPTIFNVTLVGGGDDPRGSESDYGMLIREGTNAWISNCIIMNFGEAQFKFGQQATLDQAEAGNITIDYNLWYNNGLRKGGVLYQTDSDDTADCPTTCGAATDQAFLEQQMTHNRVGVNPWLAAPTMRIQPDLQPLYGSPALDARYLISPPDDGFFDPAGANFAGAVAPGNNWVLAGWTTFSDN